MKRFLAHSKVRVVTHHRWIESQHNILFENTHLHQFVSDANFSAVLLNPDFAVDDVEVKNNTIDALCPTPTNVYKLVAIAFGVKDNFGLDAIVPNKLSVFGEQLLDVLSVSSTVAIALLPLAQYPKSPSKADLPN